jgi:hypothetical protein
MVNLKRELEALLGNTATYCYSDNTITIYDSAMYECPEMTFRKLSELSELFGSEDIRTDMDYLVKEGCETCDYGSEYGYEVIIENPSKNMEEYKTFASKV